MRKALLVTVLILSVVPNIFGQAMSVTTANTAGNVNVTVSKQCSIATFGLAFPAYDPFGAAVTQTAPIAVTCTKGTAVTVTMGAGANASGATRRMLDTVSGDFLSYEVYLDAAMTTVWDTANTKGGTSASKNTPVSLRFGLTAPDSNAYGRVAAGQDVTPGTYNDTLQATVNF